MAHVQTKPRPQTAAQVRRYLDSNRTQPCEHGHLECAATKGGPCADELAHVQTKRTPGPWVLVHDNEGAVSLQSDCMNRDGDYVAHIYNPTDAAFIHTACNAHDELVAALTRILANCQAPAKDAGQLAALVLQIEDEARAALAKVSAS